MGITATFNACCRKTLLAANGCSTTTFRIVHATATLNMAKSKTKFKNFDKN